MEHRILKKENNISFSLKAKLENTQLLKCSQRLIIFFAYFSFLYHDDK